MDKAIKSELPVKEINPVDLVREDDGTEELSQGDSKHSDTCKENNMPSLQQEEKIVKKKYGGLLPKKPPLISKDTEHAFFDSADWALEKVGAQKIKGTPEALRPKLQRTLNQQVRNRSVYAPVDDGEDCSNSDDTSPAEDQSKVDAGVLGSNHSLENQPE